MVPSTGDVSKRKREQSTRDTGRVVTWEATNKRSTSRTANQQPAKQIGSSEISADHIKSAHPDQYTTRSGKIRYTPMANFTLTEGIHAMTTCKWYDKTWERHLKKHIEDYELFSHATH
jgi:hypothetical protein